MKKFFITILCIATFALTLSAQKLPKELKTAKKALNASNYKDALNAIDAALQIPEAAGMAEAWAVKGDIYSSMISNDVDEYLKSKVTNTEYKIQTVPYASKAVEAYQKALSLSTGDADKGQKASVKGLNNLANSMSTIASELYNLQQYKDAYTCFNTILQSRDLLSGIGKNSILENEEDFSLIQFHTGLAAVNAKENDAANAIFQKLADKGYKEPAVYQQLFNGLIDTDEEAAMEVLSKGKKACADVEGSQTAFLFAEINYYLRKNDLVKLEEKLTDARAAEPDNVSLVFASGTVYDGMYQNAIESGDEATAKKNYDEAKKFYEKTLMMQEDHADACYNLGGLAYSKAASLNDIIKKLDEDSTNEGIRKYKAKKAERIALIDEARPFFERALTMDPSHRKSMIALKEIHAFKNEIELSKKYSDMLENLDEN